MRKIVAVENLSLDGVMQAPGRADEDLRGGFEHGGWAMRYDDPVKGEIMAAGMAQAGPLLFGRRTYEDLFSVWANRKDDNPFSRVLDSTQKYVASGTLTEPLRWQNSAVLPGDAVAGVAQLKRDAGPDIVVMGSGELVRSLMPHGLIDEFVLLIHPLVLGSGRRLFADDGAFATLRLRRAQTTTTGVVIATYRREE